jgi:para-aminobenzoate synthetase/4-amino-4-deoxychorismate lyase
VPDPRQGVFETLLVLEGRPVELDAHLARLHASLAELFPDHDPPPLDVPVERGPYGYLRTGPAANALRISVAPNGGGELEVQTSVRAVGRRFGPVALHSLPVPGGLGAHKWADRSLLDEAQAGLPADSLPLIVDEGGAVLEASRASVFAVRDDALFTPSLDGHILPGITRMRVLKLAGEVGIDAHEAELSRADLLTADEIFLTGSVRGIERTESLDGAPLRGGTEITDRLATELWQAWTVAKAAI